MSVHTPSYRLHRSTGQAVVTLNGRDVYLGKHGSIESRAEYDRVIAEWLANGRRVVRPPKTKTKGDDQAGDDPFINELVVSYIKFADGYYRKNGEPTKEPSNIRLAVRPLLKLYGHTPAREFGPLALKAVRAAMVEAGICRLEVNRRVGRLVRCFKWAVENELVPPSVHHGLRAVPWLRRGRSEARESDPVKPVPDAFVDAIEPFVSRQVWAMVELQRLTGMRPGEVCIMRTCDLDTSGRVWTYTPSTHKTEHHGRERTIYLGPRAQAVVRPWLKLDVAAYLFSPSEAMAERWSEQRQSRKTRVQPSQRNRRKKAPRKTPGDRYTVDSYRRALVKASAKAFPHPTLSKIPIDELTAEQRAELRAWRPSEAFHPHQLRHSAATRLRKEFGLDAAQIILGHSSPDTTLVYAEVDRKKAVEIMGRAG